MRPWCTFDKLTDIDEFIHNAIKFELHAILFTASFFLRPTTNYPTARVGLEINNNSNHNNNNSNNNNNTSNFYNEYSHQPAHASAINLSLDESGTLLSVQTGRKSPLFSWPEVAPTPFSRTKYCLPFSEGHVSKSLHSLCAVDVDSQAQQKSSTPSREQKGHQSVECTLNCYHCLSKDTE